MSISVGLQKYKLSISVGVRGTEVLAITQTSDVNPGHGTKALVWGNDVRGREKVSQTRPS